MNKKLMAVAVAGALAAPAFAFAQASTVQIYGRVHSAYDFTSQTVNKQVASNGGGSHLGFKGTESLGRGLTAWFQVESTLGPDATAGTFADRNTGVGLQGSFGNFLIGHWDLPMKWVTISGISASGDTGTMGRHALLSGGAPASTAVTTAANRASFYRRQNNTVQYWTPNWSGFEGRVAVTSNEEKTAGAAGIDPRIWSVAGKYINGPLLVGLGYERHNEPAAAGRDDTGWTFAAAYTFAQKYRVAFQYERSTYETGAGPGDATRNGWGLFGDFNVSGPHSIRAQYVKVRSWGGTIGSATAAAALVGPGSTILNFGENTGASMWGLGYKYDLSKRTNARVEYARISNDAAASYGFHITGIAAPTAGQNNSSFGLIIDHRF